MHYVVEEDPLGGGAESEQGPYGEIPCGEISCGEISCGEVCGEIECGA